MHHVHGLQREVARHHWTLSDPAALGAGGCPNSSSRRRPRRHTVPNAPREQHRRRHLALARPNSGPSNGASATHGMIGCIPPSDSMLLATVLPWQRLLRVRGGAGARSPFLSTRRRGVLGRGLVPARGVRRARRPAGRPPHRGRHRGFRDHGQRCGRTRGVPRLSLHLRRGRRPIPRTGNDEPWCATPSATSSRSPTAGSRNDSRAGRHAARADDAQAIGLRGSLNDEVSNR